MSGFYVSRQSNYYDQGAFSVEIARTLDHAGPGMLALELGPEGEYDDPREAAKAALELVALWKDFQKTIVGDDIHIPITLAMNHMVYPTVEDDHTEDILEWAEKQYEALPKCEQCGSLGAAEYQDEGGLVVLACTDYHAELLLAPDNYDDGDV